MIKFGINASGTFGDVLYMTPVIAYLSKCHNQKIHVETTFPEIFKNNPFVEKIYDVKNNQSFSEDIVTYNVNEIYHGDLFRQKKMHAIDFWSTNLGFILTPEEKTLLFYPDELDIELPKEKYVVINPSVTAPSRTWDKDKWERLISLIIDANIKVVVVGKEINYEHDFNRGVMDVGGDKILNLTNNLNISQLWHIVQNSLATITLNTGLWPLAGTTDANIIAIGGSYNPYYRAPYRYGSQNYKQYFVGGSCKLFCHTDMKYNSLGDVKVTGGYPIESCFENKPTYECHPFPDAVFNTLLEIIKLN